MSATIGTLASRTMVRSAVVASTVGQDTRMMSAPASSQRRIWSMVATASSVGVLVMVCTVMGASPPTGTEPTMICRDLRRSISRHGRIEDMAGDIGACRRAAKPHPMGARDLSHCVNGVNGIQGAAMPKLARLPANDLAPDQSRADVRRIRRYRHRYYAFLSYSHDDEEIADWLHDELEGFRVPHSLQGRLTENGTVPKRLTPIFRDRHELAAADDLTEEI